MSNVVLLVEDSDFIRDMYKLKLSKAKIDVLEAVDGSMALSMISEHKPKLVLLDLMMPNVTGLEVLEELDKHKMTPELPVIVLTNIMDKPTIDKAKQLGARDYIIKTDLTPGEVLDKVMTYLA